MRATEAKDITVSEADVSWERERALRRLSDPLAAVTPGPLDIQSAERLLDSVLQERNLSREEFDMVIRRNAHLRMLAAAEVSVTDEDLRREFDRLYGPRVYVRHIQMANLNEVQRAKERLAAGEPFADVATQLSANTGSASRGGLLEPFSAGDDEVPSALREAAFALQPGQVSEAIRVGQWYHLLQLESVVPPLSEDFEQVREGLTRSYFARITEPRMFELFEKLFRDATIEVHDPLLRVEFEKRHPATEGKR